MKSLMPKEDKLFVYKKTFVKTKKDLAWFLHQEHYFNDQPNSLKMFKTFINTNILSVVNRLFTCNVNCSFRYVSV